MIPTGDNLPAVFRCPCRSNRSAVPSCPSKATPRRARSRMPAVPPRRRHRTGVGRDKNGRVPDFSPARATEVVQGGFVSQTDRAPGTCKGSWCGDHHSRDGAAVGQSRADRGDRLDAGTHRDRTVRPSAVADLARGSVSRPRARHPRRSRRRPSRSRHEPLGPIALQVAEPRERPGRLPPTIGLIDHLGDRGTDFIE